MCRVLYKHNPAQSSLHARQLVMTARIGRIRCLQFCFLWGIWVWTSRWLVIQTPGDLEAPLLGHVTFLHRLLCRSFSSWFLQKKGKETNKGEGNPAAERPWRSAWIGPFLPDSPQGAPLCQICLPVASKTCSIISGNFVLCSCTSFAVFLLPDACQGCSR